MEDAYNLYKRILRRDPEKKYRQSLDTYVGEIVNTRGLHLVIDGKVLRASMEKVENFRASQIAEGTQ